MQDPVWSGAQVSRLHHSRRRWLRCTRNNCQRRPTRNLQLIALPATVLLALFMWTSSPSAATAQVNQYSRDGLSFNYPLDWPVTDESNATAQNLSLDRSHKDAMIMIVVMRAQMNAQQFAEAQPKLTKAITTALATEIVNLGAQSQRISISENIGGVTAQGQRFRASLQGETGDADVYWLHLGGRLVHVIFVGSDQERARAAPAWNMICSTLRINASPIEPTPQAMAGEIARGYTNQQVTRRKDEF